jgi:hypothetical protein
MFRPVIDDVIKQVPKDIIIGLAAGGLILYTVIQILVCQFAEITAYSFPELMQAQFCHRILDAISGPVIEEEL